MLRPPNFSNIQFHKVIILRKRITNSTSIQRYSNISDITQTQIDMKIKVIYAFILFYLTIQLCLGLHYIHFKSYGHTMASSLVVNGTLPHFLLKNQTVT